MLRICHENKVDRNMSVCLYTADGMPLTDDPFFNTCRCSNVFEDHFQTLFYCKCRELSPMPNVMSWLKVYKQLQKIK